MSPAFPSPVHPVRRRLRPAVLLLAVTAALVGSSTAVAVADPGTDAATPAGRYYSITPTRILDTRNSGGAIANEATRIVDLTRALGGSASAVVINLTVTNPTWGGYLTAYPAGTAKPVASSLNFDKGQTRANSVTVAVGQGTLQNRLAISAAVANNGRAHVIVDVLGWYGKGGGAAGSTYLPLASPVRLFDTRGSIGGLTTSYPKNIGIVTLDYGSAAMNKTITAAVMNITVTNPRGLGNLTLWNGYGAPPLVSTLNFVPGQTVANLAVVPVRCSDSSCKTLTFSIKNNLSPYTQVIGDISGVYTTPMRGGLVYQPVSPTRITDSREHQPYAKLGAKGAGSSDVTRWMSADTRALNVNLTAVKPSMSTYLTVYPSGTNRPVVSNINVTRGIVAANAAQVKISRDGKFITANSTGWVDVVVDLQGMFVLDPVTSASVASTDGVVSGAAVSGTVS